MTDVVLSVDGDAADKRGVTNVVLSVDGDAGDKGDVRISNASRCFVNVS